MTYRIQRDGLEFEVRPNTLDEWVVDEVGRPGMYLRPLDIGPEDTVLDVGMNIGAFAVMARATGAAVVGFEPDPANYALARRNLAHNGYSEVHTRNAALGSGAGTTMLYLNEGRNRGGHTTRPVRGRRGIVCPRVDINQALARYPFTKVKLDCEGSEVPIISAVKDWLGVTHIRWEYHRRLLQDESNRILHTLATRLERHGFTVTGPNGAEGADQVATGPRSSRSWCSMYTAVRHA